MRASDLIAGLRAMIDIHGDLDVVVETESDVEILSSTVDYDQFEVDGSQYIVLATKGVVDDDDG